MKYLSQTSKLFILRCNILLLSISLSGCFQRDPIYIPSFSGDVEISKNSKGELCFKPLFSTLVNDGEFSSGVKGESININYMKMKSFKIYDPNITESNSVKLRINPKYIKYFSIKEGQDICLYPDSSMLEQVIYAPMDQQKLEV